VADKPSEQAECSFMEYAWLPESREELLTGELMWPADRRPQAVIMYSWMIKLVQMIFVGFVNLSYNGHRTHNNMIEF
jgi:hypothetical protein